VQLPPTQPPAVYPKCGGVRFVDDGYELGLRSYEVSAHDCSVCGYVEFSASKNKLDVLAQRRANAAATAATQQEKDRKHGRF
jgi:hypothetical protein